MGESVFLENDSLGGGAGESSQSVVRIAEPHAREDPRHKYARFEKPAFLQRYRLPVVRIQKARPQRNFNFPVDDRLDQALDHGGAVLSVSVEMNDNPGTLQQREIAAGLQRRALPQVDIVTHAVHIQTVETTLRRRCGPVIDDDNRVAEGQEIQHRGAENGVLVVSRYDNENGAILHISSEPEPYAGGKIAMGSVPPLTFVELARDGYPRLHGRMLCGPGI